eukprot:jgi/Hompol1/285/HPOL_000400-RA
MFTSLCTILVLALQQITLAMRLFQLNPVIIWNWDTPATNPKNATATTSSLRSIRANWSNIADFKLMHDSNQIVACGMEQNFIEVWGMHLHRPSSRHSATAQTRAVVDQPAASPKDQRVPSSSSLQMQSIESLLALKPSFDPDHFSQQQQDQQPTREGQHASPPPSTGQGMRVVPSDQPNLQERKVAETSITALDKPETTSEPQRQPSTEQKSRQQSVKLAKTIDGEPRIPEATGALGIPEQTRDTRPATGHTSQQLPASGQYIPTCDGNCPLNLDMSRFIMTSAPGRTAVPPMPYNTALPSAGTAGVRTRYTDDEHSLAQSSDPNDIIDAMLFRSASMESILTTRLTHLRLAREAWTESNPKLALDVILGIKDHSALIDILRILNLKPRLLTLEMAAAMLPALCELLFEYYEDYIRTACSTVQLLYKSFAPLIADTIRSAESHNATSVDMTFEQRWLTRLSVGLSVCVCQGENALIESPTGTGKTLCLLCAALAWKESFMEWRRLATISAHQPSDSLHELVDRASIAAFGAPHCDRRSRNIPKIYYASRTHSQLSQVVAELRNTSYQFVKLVLGCCLCIPADPNAQRLAFSDYFRVTTSILGGRDQMCINPKVTQAPAATRAGKCRSLVSKDSCTFHTASQAPKTKAAAASTIMDMEDLVKFGQQTKSCPYFISKDMLPRADLIFLPYNYLIDATARSSLRIDLNNAILIFDEGHNVSPLDSFVHEMAIPFPNRLENEHVIDPSQMFISIVENGPGNHKLSSSFNNRDSKGFLPDLGNAIVNFARIVPDGMLVFFTSYKILDDAISQWKQASCSCLTLFLTTSSQGKSIWESLTAYKDPILEPRDKKHFQDTIVQFNSLVDRNHGRPPVFFAVCRGKASEGLDFSDRKGRAVVICGIPYPASKDPKVQSIDSFQKSFGEVQGKLTLFFKKMRELESQGFSTVPAEVGAQARPVDPLMVKSPVKKTETRHIVESFHKTVEQQLAATSYRTRTVSQRSTIYKLDSSISNNEQESKRVKQDLELKQEQEQEQQQPQQKQQPPEMPPRRSSSTAPGSHAVRYLETIKAAVSRDTYKRFQVLLLEYKETRITVDSLIRQALTLFMAENQATGSQIAREFKSFIGKRHHDTFERLFGEICVNKP